MAWIKTINPEAAEGPLREEYDAAVKRAGKVYQILQIQSINPGTLHHGLALYVAAMHGASGLSRLEREFLATVVSRANHCFY